LQCGSAQFLSLPPPRIIINLRREKGQQSSRIYFDASLLKIKIKSKFINYSSPNSSTSLHPTAHLS